MENRHPLLAELLTGLEQVFADNTPPEPLRTAATQAFRALETVYPPSQAERSWLDCCQHLEPALAEAERIGSPALAATARVMRKLSPALSWGRRPGSDRDPAFHDGHANAILIGSGGLEERRDVWLGVTLMAPDVTYPFHRHSPDELYIILSNSSWYRDDSGWFDPDCGGYVFNPSRAKHSMRSKNTQLLAFWLLWSREDISL